MKYCKKCIQPDTRPGIVFYEDGICAACHHSSDELPKIDWNDRKKQLLEIAKTAKKTKKGAWDCAIGVSGGKDSHFQAIYAKEQLGLSVLLVNYAPDDLTEEGHYNLMNLANHGFDLISIRPNPEVMSKCCKKAFYEQLNPVKPTEYVLHVVTLQIALKFGIPLVIHGENIAQTLGVLNARKSDDDALGCRNNQTVNGGNASDWLQDGITMDDLYFYQYPDEKILKENIRAIHLNYYAKEFSRRNNMEFAISKGLIGRKSGTPKTTGMLNKYTCLDSNMQLLNQMLKYYKFGFGFVTDEVCYDIRIDLMDRDEAIILAKEYDGKCSESYILEFCNYINISIEEFWKVVDMHVNKDLFEKCIETNMWKPKFNIGEDFNV